MGTTNHLEDDDKNWYAVVASLQNMTCPTMLLSTHFPSSHLILDAIPCGGQPYDSQHSWQVMESWYNHVLYFLLRWHAYVSEMNNILLSASCLAENDIIHWSFHLFFWGCWHDRWDKFMGHNLCAKSMPSIVFLGHYPTVIWREWICLAWMSVFAWLSDYTGAECRVVAWWFHI